MEISVELIEKHRKEKCIYTNMSIRIVHSKRVGLSLTLLTLGKGGCQTF